MKRVTLHIDRLVLRGFRPEDRHGVAAGLQQELARILADPQVAGAIATHGGSSHLSLGRLTLHRNATPQQIGAQVARGIRGRMNK